MRVLVTGGAGYIGSHCERLLHNRGFETLVLDNLQHGHRDAVSGPLFEGDLLSESDLNAVFGAQHFDAVVHFAALVVVEESVAQPRRYMETNSIGTLNLLEAMRKHDVPKLVFSSTAAVYGDPERIPIAESDSLRPVNPYGVSKLLAEHMIDFYGRMHGLRWAAFRYFNVAGREFPYPSQELRDHDTHLLTRVLNVAAGVVPHLEIYGTDYDTSDGTCVRDYVHVSDLCEAHLSGLEYLSSDGPNACFNIGTGKGFSVKEVVEVCREVTGRPIPVKLLPRRSGDPKSLVASSEKLSNAMGWHCKRDLSTIVTSAWKWHSKQPAVAAQ
jgi:UDP-glucose 4-epimerase